MAKRTFMNKNKKIKYILYFLGLTLILAFISDLQNNPEQTLEEIFPIIIIGLLIYSFNKSYFKRNFKKFYKQNKLFYFFLLTLLVSILTNTTIPLLLTVIAISLIYFIYLNLRKQKILNSGIDKIDLMSGEQFEIFLEMHFRQKKYKVERTQLSGDYGADLIITDNGKRIAVQAKRYSNKVGLEAVQQVVAAMAYYECESGLVVTNNYFTPAAINLAKSNKISLWNRDDLIKQIVNLDNKVNRLGDE